MKKRFFVLLLLLPAAIFAEDWYRSNQAGMALEKIPSRMVALHYGWALSVEAAGYAALPELLRSYYNSSYTMEQRFLYERGALKRRQWIFRDSAGITRVNASLPAVYPPAPKSTAKAKAESPPAAPQTVPAVSSGEAVESESSGDPAAAFQAKDPAADSETAAAAGEQSESGEIPPFMEIFSADRRITETHQYIPAGVYTTRYSYREEILIKAETFLDGAPLWTDNYRYTRVYLLRGVDRKYHEAGKYAEPLQGTNGGPAAPGTRAPVTPAGLDLRESPPIPGFIAPDSPYDNSIMTEVLRSIYAVSAARVVYDTDSLGRVLAETRYGEGDKVLAVITNTWERNRIAEINWSSAPDKGRIVFRYSGDDRVAEEDYRNGVLERRVTRAGDEEVEEIIMNDKVILRAVWKDGRKISEERPRS